MMFNIYFPLVIFVLLFSPSGFCFVVCCVWGCQFYFFLPQKLGKYLVLFYSPLNTALVMDSCL